MKNIFVLGSLNMDLSISCDRLPVAGETLIGGGFISNSGGKGGNQAVAASKLGGKVTMLGAVGKDVFGCKLIKSLADYGVNTKYVVKKDCSSGVAVIVVENDNRIILDSGANYELKLADFEDALRKKARKGDILITQLETPLEVVESGLELAKSLEMVTILNPAPAAELTDKILSNVDYVIPNESEAEMLTKTNYNSNNVDEIIFSLLKLKVNNVIMTLGDKGCAYYDGKQVVRVQAKKVDAVDTTAAGDTFIGAFAAKLAVGESIEKALEFSNAASALTVTRKGAQQAIPTLNEVNDFVAG